jgi:class 3 adenylate cyclase
MDVAVWLRGLGLGKYEAAFRENEIDETVLPSLTHETLKEIGVTAVGHRLKLLDAIAALRTDAGAKPPAADAASTSAAPSAPPEARAERRQVTVMFSDLVGSTALSARMDPEDLREVISAYQKCVAETVQRFGGFVAKYMGDGVLVYFGYPQAHEDDAERAVRAGLELIQAVGGLKPSAPLQTRVGIATGLVVVGDLIGSGAAQEQTVVGETANLAARLQSLAQPNMVVIAASTRKLLGNLFELEDLGAKDLKGIAGPVKVWTALRPSSVPSRFEALHGGALTELVGREEELELLLRRWSKAKAGEGQVVLVSGEAGIGKSRLTAALLERLAGEPHTRLRYFCSPQRTDSALYPMIAGQLERAAGFTYDDTSVAKLDKLDTLLAQQFTPREEAALFAEMLSLPNDGRYPTLELTPQQRRQKTLEALTAQIEARSRQKPVLMIFEDVHWIDPTSLEALSRAVDRIRTLRVLLMVTYRSEFEPPWIGRHHVTALILNRLGDREVGTIIERVIGNNPLPASIRKEIIERTDGIPLFVEEITKSVLEAVGEGMTERAGAGVLTPSVAVPASLHASLMARLDRLGAAKEIAQIGAAIGREFSHALLRAVASKPEVALAAALDRLLAAGLLFREGVPPHATYLFKHALVQDAAYGTLLREPRRALHARIAQTLESEFPEIAGNQPELLARHYTEAGMIERAAGLWGKAGARFLDRSALVEAIEALRRALDQIATLPSTPVLRRREVNLQVALLAPLAHVKGYTAPETKAAAERARLLIEQAEARGEPPEDPMQLFRVLNIFWNASAAAFNGDVMRELATQVLALAEKQGAALPLVTGHHLMGASLVWTGEIVEGRTHLDQSVALYDPAENPVTATYLGAHQTAGLSVRSVTLWLLGYPQAALADADQALADRREIDRATPLIEALAHSCSLHILCGKHLIANALVDELIALAHEKDAFYLKALGMSVQGWLFALTGKASDAVRALTFGTSRISLNGSNAGGAVFQIVFGQVLCRAWSIR